MIAHALRAEPLELESAPRELGQQLGELHTSMQRLAELATEKIAALRGADCAALKDCAAREERVLRDLLQSEPARKAVLARVAQGLHCADPGTATLTDVLERLPEPLASSLRARGTALRHVALELRQKNQLVAAVAQNLLSHVRGVFAEVARAAQEPCGYGPGGQQAVSSAQRWVDAVG